MLNEFKEKSKKEVEKLTAMTVRDIEIVARNIYIPENKENLE